MILIGSKFVPEGALIHEMKPRFNGRFVRLTVPEGALLGSLNTIKVYVNGKTSDYFDFKKDDTIRVEFDALVKTVVLVCYEISAPCEKCS